MIVERNEENETKTTYRLTLGRNPLNESLVASLIGYSLELVHSAFTEARRARTPAANFMVLMKIKDECCQFSTEIVRTDACENSPFFRQQHDLVERTLNLVRRRQKRRSFQRYDDGGFFQHRIIQERIGSTIIRLSRRRL
jgi:hypothetical protein